MKDETTQVAMACCKLALLKVIFPSKVVVWPSLDRDEDSSSLSAAAP